MEFSKYQQQANETDWYPKEGSSRLVFLPNLIQASTRLARLMEDSTHNRKAKLAAREQLGDILWYLSAIATHSGLTLDDVADSNLSKVASRWKGKTRDNSPYDARYTSRERLPRALTLVFSERLIGNIPAVTLSTKLSDGSLMQLGNEINDNAHDPDGYRYHDVFHFAYATFLGWSPVVRHLLHRKRKSMPAIDEIEDGARARDIEEGLTALIFQQAKTSRFFAGVQHLDPSLLSTIERMTMGLEVKSRPIDDWNTAVLRGYDAFRRIKANRGGTLILDADRRRLAVYSHPGPRLRPIKSTPLSH